MLNSNARWVDDDDALLEETSGGGVGAFLNRLPRSVVHKVRFGDGKTLRLGVFGVLAQDGAANAAPGWRGTRRGKVKPKAGVDGAGATNGASGATSNALKVEVLLFFGNFPVG